MLVQVATIPAGSRGFDALGDPAPPGELVPTGWLFRTFYIAQSSSYSTKITDATIANGRARVQAHLAAGVGVLINYESSAERPLKGGGQGRIDGAWSLSMCTRLTYPTSLPILVSVDIESRAGGKVRPEVEAYVREFARACAPYPIGIYGGTPILHACADINRLGWQAMAASWSSGSWPQAVVHVKQRRPTVAETAAQPWANRQTIDANDTLRPCPVWSQTGDDELRPQHSEDSMYRLDFNGMILEVGAHAIRRVISGRVSGVGPTAVKVDRLTVADHVAELHTAGPSPFDGSIAGYADPDLDAAWKERPSIDSAAVAHITGGAVNLPAVVGTITFG